MARQLLRTWRAIGVRGKLFNVGQNEMRTLSCIYLAVVTTTMLFAAETFYPKGSVSDFEQEWYAKHLSAMHEPVLGSAEAPGNFAFRVLYLPTWGRPVAVRVEKKGDRIVRRSVILTGAGGYDPGQIKSQTEVTLSKNDLSTFKKNLEESGLLSLPAKDGVIGCDGSELIIEVLEGGKHLVFVRWTPEYDTEKRKLSAVVSLYQQIFQEAGFWKAEKQPNQSSQHNASSGHAGCFAPTMPATRVAGS